MIDKFNYVSLESSRPAWVDLTDVLTSYRSLVLFSISKSINKYAQRFLRIRIQLSPLVLNKAQTLFLLPHSAHPITRSPLIIRLPDNQLGGTSAKKKEITNCFNFN